MMAKLQSLGRALMMPIAVLPAAALLLRLGVYFQTVSWLQWGNFVWELMAAGGDAVFANLPLLFAIGVAIGFADGAGAAALAAGVGQLILESINTLTVVTIAADGTEQTIDMGVLGGIIIGITAAYLYNNFRDANIPDYLAFFGGRRLPPIMTAFAAIAIGLLASFIWPPIGRVINEFGEWILGLGALGALIYGVANRALIPTGLHHILNTLVWFEFGTYVVDGETYNGEITRFFQGDPEAGLLLAGFFAIMMFGLPAAAFAMYQQADEDQKKATGASMFSIGFTSFLTGITEPIEYSFMFLAPVLYGVHAVLTGIALYVCALLGIRNAFGFSAGFIDYMVNLPLAAKPLLLLGIGVIFGVIYYAVFTFFIKAQDLPTPGRTSRSERAEAAAATA